MKIRSIDFLFKLNEGTHPLLQKIDVKGKGDLENIIDSLIKLYSIENYIIKKHDGSLILSNDNYDFSLKISLSIMGTSDSKEDVLFIVRKISKKSPYAFSIKTKEELFEKSSGLYALGIGFDEVDEDYEESQLMMSFLKVIGLDEFWDDSGQVNIKTPNGETISLEIETIGSNDSFGLRISRS